MAKFRENRRISYVMKMSCKVYYPVTRRDEINNRCSLLKMKCGNAAQDM